MKIISSFVITCVLAGTASADLLFDQGASTGNYGGAWTSWTTEQNFLDQVTLPTASRIDRYTTYTSGAYYPHDFTGSFHLKLYSDAAGVPGSILDEQDVFSHLLCRRVDTRRVLGVCGGAGLDDALVLPGGD